MASKAEARRVASPGPETKIDWTAVDSKTESDNQGDFDWDTSPAVILHDQAAVAAYHNKFGELVIMQRDTLGAPEATLYVAPENVEKFLEGLSRLVRGDDK